mgnify:CR=1 FL=1
MMNNLYFFVQNKTKKEDIMNTLYKIALAISIIGCINWGLVGLFDFNLVEYLFGDGTLITRIVYILVLISGLIDIGIFTKDLD